MLGRGKTTLDDCRLRVQADLWNQRRVRADGSIRYVLGGLQKRRVPLPASDWDWGVPEKGARWDDQMALRMLIGQFYHRSPVVLLSENTRMDRLGLRRLLRERERVAPILDRRIADHLSLTALFKKGRTT